MHTLCKLNILLHLAEQLYLPHYSQDKNHNHHSIPTRYSDRVRQPFYDAPTAALGNLIHQESYRYILLEKSVRRVLPSI